MTDPVAPDRDISRQGQYAGFVSRLGGLVIDVVAIAVGFALGGHVIEFIVSSLRTHPFHLTGHPNVGLVALLVWAFVYCAYPLSVSGKTLGMAVVGVRAVRKDGSDLDARHAVVRVIFFPLSFVLFGFGFLLVILRRDRRALQDLIADTAVVYSWDARAARLRFLSRQSQTAG
jgi:uncharacterized RDD family membrane protein YckC